MTSLTDSEEARLGITPESIGFEAWKDVVLELLTNALASKRLGESELVRQALEAEDEFIAKDDSKYAKAMREGPGAQLARRGWLLNELLDPKHAVLMPANDDDPQVDLLDCCIMIQAMVIGLLRFVSTDFFVSLEMGSQTAMVLMHMQTGNAAEQKVDVWSWRTAGVLSTQCSTGKMNLLFAIVTRQLSPPGEAHSHNGVPDARHEVYSIFEEMSLEASMSNPSKPNSKIELKPLSAEGRDEYMVQVLAAKHGYRGSIQGVPDTLRQFMSETAAGNPKYIKEMLDAIKTAGMLQFELPELDNDITEPRIKDRSRADLATVPTPSKMKATIMQQFDTLDPNLQMALKVASPLLYFSTGMLADVGLPDAVRQKLQGLFEDATREGILQAVSPVPEEVTAADPTATLAYGWLLHVMRHEVLASLLHSARERVRRPGWNWTRNPCQVPEIPIDLSGNWD